MRLICAVGAALLLACGFATASRAADPPDAATAPTPGCNCPAAAQHHVRPHRGSRMHARYRRRAPPRRYVMMPPPYLPTPMYYAPVIPTVYDSSYDRAMTLHYRSPEVTGIYDPDPGWPATPPPTPYQAYRGITPDGTVLQYDGLTGQYIPLSQWDARRIQATMQPLPPAAPTAQ
ncbi:MAG TPA: hypothetical protein VHW90_09150 [Stellaceae bacterium]|nr:hypothetical protein [Stellaceae bacterium]